ncbi:RHS repeat-associated core domain-containing protein [Aeromicrobium sp. CF3.5]|uniref:RHS repeat-associated core domain-containing protein n=1 Tax=Aeromicrobium sp. CF3.5 TaxID=3373078 RepID=UPI003EE621AD
MGLEAPASAAANPAPEAGQRANATRLDFTVSGTAGVSVDVGTGNALFTDQLITLPGVNNDVPISVAYNSSLFGSDVPSAVTGDTGSGWSITGFDNRLLENSDGSVTFHGPAGLTGVFAASGTGYTAPAQYQADLVKTGSTGWTLTDHQSNTTLTFNAEGRQTKSEDRNDNLTQFTYDGDLPASIVSSRGSTATSTLTIATSENRITKLTQSAGSLSRQVQFAYTSAGELETIVNTKGDLTSFYNPAADDGKVVRITNAKNATTALAYSGTKTASVTQSNAPGAGTSTTRLTYPSSTQTLVADPTTDQSAPVASVPRTTYALTADKLVSSATDPNGHARSATYTSLGQVATQTPAAGGTTTNTYGANGAESLTSSASPGGATGTASYDNTGANAHLPSSTTSDAGNSLNYTYNGAGNQLTNAQGTGPQAKVTYNSNGTVATSASPGAASGVQTRYFYDWTKNLVHIAPVSGATLGNRDYEWDAFGRLYSADDGRGEATRYLYDKLDRITRVDYTDETTNDVIYTYDVNGQILTRADVSGVTTYTYDVLGRVLTKKNTAGGETMSYTYDKAGNMKTQTDYHGTITYTYDDAFRLKYMTYPQGGGTSRMSFAYDDSGRRTDMWLKSNSTNTTWSAHTKTTYDASGRVVGVKSERGPASSPTSVIDLTYCFSSGTTPAGGCTTSSTSDRANIQWVKNAVDGQATKFTYNADNRLTGSVITGGSNPRTYAYTYDAAGNRLTAAVNGSNPSTQTLTYNNANQITNSGWGYDPAGNLSFRPGMGAEFNTAGQMRSRTAESGPSANTQDTEYTYAGTDQNEITRAHTPGDVTYDYAYGAPDQNGLPVIQEVSRTEDGAALVDAYVTHDNTGLPVMLQASTGQTGMYVYDGQGNPVSLTSEGATTSYLYELDPYGTATTTQNAGDTAYVENPYTYGGGLQDRSTGLIKFGQRWYDSTTGSWIQQDALNAPLDPTNANRYNYVGGNPVNRFDPTGLAADPLCGTNGSTGYYTPNCGGYIAGGSSSTVGGQLRCTGVVFGQVGVLALSVTSASGLVGLGLGTGSASLAGVYDPLGATRSGCS